MAGGCAKYYHQLAVACDLSRRQSGVQIENTIREIKEAQAEKERTKDARNKLNEFKTKTLESSEKYDEIARKIAKIQRRQERKNNKKMNEANTEKSICSKKEILS